MVTIAGNAKESCPAPAIVLLTLRTTPSSGTVVGNVEISGFYELPPGEKLENHSREPLKIYANEYTGPLMGL